ncbi:MAG: nitroreductase family protein [Actinomycetota bacterium]
MSDGRAGPSFTDLEKLLRRRRMTRRFDGGPELDELLGVLDSSLRAPSAGFSQGVHIVVLSGEDVSTFWSRSGAGAWFEQRSPGVVGAPHVLLVFGDRSEYVDRYSLDDKRELGFDSADRWQTPYWLVDAGMVVQNFLLLAEERRWGALFFGVFGDQDDYFEELGVPASAHCIGAIAVGHRSALDAPSGSPTTRARRQRDEIIHVGRWLQGHRGPQPLGSTDDEQP